MRHRLIALPLAALASLALASVALGGGWAQVTVQGAPPDPPAGEETTIQLSVLQHGVTPVSWPRLTVVATETGSSAVVSTKAQPKGPEGTYVATILFPSAGEWTLTFVSPDLEMAGSVALNVAPAVAAAPVGVAAEPAAADPASDSMPVVLVLLAAVAALAIGGGLLVRGRRTAGESSLSVRT